MTAPASRDGDDRLRLPTPGSVAPATHDDRCSCARCVGFQPGNDLAIRHGVKALVKLAPRAAEIAEELRAAMTVRSPGDEFAVGLCAMNIAQQERYHLLLARRQSEELEALQDGRPLDPATRDDLRRLAQDARGWANTTLKYLDALGLTPTAHARLIGDVVLVQRAADEALDRLRQEGRQIRQRHEGQAA